MVQDGPKKRPTLEIDPAVAPTVKRMYDMAEAGNGTLEIIRTLNNEGIASPRGKLWARTSVHNILTNEAYTGTLVWGANAKDNADPVRVENAFPAIITRAQLQRVGKHLSSRAPKFSHPRRVGSSYLLSGLAKCKTCNTPLIGRFAQSGSREVQVLKGDYSMDHLDAWYRTHRDRHVPTAQGARGDGGCHSDGGRPKGSHRHRGWM